MDELPAIVTKEEIQQMITDAIKKEVGNFFQTDTTHTFEKSMQILNGRDIQVGRSIGTRIGTATDQKIGFFGKAPVAQQGAISAPSGGATIDSQARTAITSIITTLQTLGLTA